MKSILKKVLQELFVIHSDERGAPHDLHKNARSFHFHRRKRIGNHDGQRMDESVELILWDVEWGNLRDDVSEETHDE